MNLTELPMTERQLSDAFAEMARALGWLCYHTHDSRRSAPGFPDWVCVRRERVLFVELKTAKGRLGPEQTRWLAALLEAGVDVATWRPADWRSGEIERVLR